MATPQKIEPPFADAITEPQRTEHPHIVRVPGVVGGRPVIEGTRISVDLIARFVKAGTDPWVIVATYPHLKAAAVFDAISYYLDHREEFERYFEESTPEKLAERYGFEVDERGRVRFRDR